MTPLRSDRLPGPSVPRRRDDIRTWGCTRFLCFFRIFCGLARAATTLLLLAAIILGVQPEPARAQTTAAYTVTFKGNWTTASTTVAVPGSAHFTTLIGAVHDSDVTFWTPGGTATAGVEGVAEFGSTGIFKSEINSATTGTVRSIVQENGTGATGTNTFEITFSRTHPLLTLLSMIGPSPDWFVGVSGLSMLDGSDAWRSSRTVDLFPYDAGTEDGENFSLTNPDTNPKETITSLRNQGKFTDTRMARLTFTLKTPPQNNAPEFSSTSTTRSFTETVGDATAGVAGNVGVAVTADDDDDGDTLAYSLEGTDAGKFTIVSGSGQIRTRVGEIYDREAKASYLVTVKADDRNGGTDAIAVTIDVTNESEPPLAPVAPSVFSAGATNLNVSWNEPSNAGRPGITGYKVQYRQGTSGRWIDVPQGDISGTSATIAVSDSSVQHQAQVLATNSDGDGPWSEPGSSANRRPLLPPTMEAEEVDTDRELREFVEDAAKRIEASGSFEETLRLLEEFRDSERGWNDGSMYLVLLTKKGGVYFHADDREAEDLDWSGVLSCEEEGPNVEDTRDGCFFKYNGDRGYAHPLSATHVPLAHGEEEFEFVLLGGFDETSEGKPFPSTGEIDGPSVEAGEVDSDSELREFVEDAGRVIEEFVEDFDIDPAQLRGILRGEGPWRGEDVYVYILDEMGRVIFDGEDRGREQKDESAKQYVRDLIAGAEERIVEYREEGSLRRGYAVRVEVPLDEGGEHVYIVGSGYRVEEQPGGSDSGGGGCAVGGSGSGGALGPFFIVLALSLTVFLRSAGGSTKSCRYSVSATKPSSLPKWNKQSGFCGEYSPRNV